MFIKIMYTMLLVSDQDKALEFYLKLGFEKKIDVPGTEGRFLTLAFAGQDVQLLLWKGKPSAMGNNDDSSIDMYPGMIFIESENLRKDVEILRTKGVTFLEPDAIDYPYGVRITAIDPDGHRIALRERKR